MRLKARRPGAAEAIRFILVAQIAAAGWIVARDLAPALPALVRFDATQDLRAPISPGDQTRRFNPNRLPDLPAPPGRRSLPPTPDMPDRLQFREHSTTDAILTGSIAEGDALRFLDWLKGRATPPAKVWLHSPGGSVTDALAIGRTIRDAGIVTAIEAGDVCFSACPYILAGGVLRLVDPDGFVGVHQHYFGENIALPAFLAVRDIQRGQADVVRYLSDMGIDLRITEHALATPPEDIYVLTPRELELYRFTLADAPP